MLSVRNLTEGCNHIDMMFNVLRNGVRPELIRGAFWFMIIFKVIWLIIVIVFMIWIMRHLMRAHKSHMACCGDRRMDLTPTSTEALEIVRERYAKGEITKEQYDQYLLDLK